MQEAVGPTAKAQEEFTRRRMRDMSHADHRRKEERTYASSGNSDSWGLGLPASSF